MKKPKEEEVPLSRKTRRGSYPPGLPKTGMTKKRSKQEVRKREKLSEKETYRKQRQIEMQATGRYFLSKQRKG